MRPLQIVMPMAGLGSRFAKAGIKTPKPMIEVEGKPMFLKALSSINDIAATKEYIFIIQKKHDDEQQLGALIANALPEAKIIKLPEVTRGAAETALAAKPLLKLNAGLIVMDCDLWFHSEEYNQKVIACLQDNDDSDGVLLNFKATSPSYSYASVDSGGYVTMTAEKRVISDRAITGAYFFSRTNIFTLAAEKLLKKHLVAEAPEYYLSSIYNILIQENFRINSAMVDQHESFGTPEELDSYLNKNYRG